MFNPFTLKPKMNWMENPNIMGLLSAGLGILGAKGTYGALGPALSQGGLLGLQGLMQAKQMQDQGNDRRFDRYVTGKKLDFMDKEFGFKERELAEKEAQRKQLAALTGQVNSMFFPQQQGAQVTPLRPDSDPQPNAIGPNGELTGPNIQTAPVPVNANPMSNPETWYKAATMFAGVDAQQANSYRQIGDSIRAQNDKDIERTKPEYLLQPVAGYPGVLYHRGDAKFYRDGVELTGKELEDLRVKVAEATRPQNNINVDASSYDKTGGAERAKAAQEQQTKAMKAEEFAGTVEFLADAMEGYSGGPITQFQGAIGQVFPESEYGKIASIDQLAQAVVGKNIGSVRATGSGSVSDFESKKFIGAFPSLATTPEGRQFMKIVARRVADREIIAADIYSEMAEKGPVRLGEWRKKVREQVGPLFSKEEEDFMRGRKTITPKKPWEREWQR